MMADDLRSGAPLETQPHARHWDEKFRSRGWGRYPPEDLVRFVMRRFGGEDDRGAVRALEVGCGPGANLWFLHREGFEVSGIDGSATAIEIARARLAQENAALNPAAPDLRVGDLSRLPWPDARFDLVIDVFAIYANPVATIRGAIAEIVRVLKPGGHVYAKFWGKRTTGYGRGREIEPGTFDDIPVGGCAGMGLTHFVNDAGLRALFGAFDDVQVDRLLRDDAASGDHFEELALRGVKAISSAPKHL